MTLLAFIFLAIFAIRLYTLVPISLPAASLHDSLHFQPEHTPPPHLVAKMGFKFSQHLKALSAEKL